MSKRRQWGMLAALLAVVILLGCFVTASNAAPQFANDQFKGVWEYSDKLVDERPDAGRGYTWGPVSGGIFTEDYADAPSGKRQVQYFDKSRMEVAPTGVTNGLLTKELVSGFRQDGNTKFTQLSPSTVQIAGDNNNPVSPTYASFKDVVTLTPGENVATNRVGQTVNQAIDKNGKVTTLTTPPTQIAIETFDPTLNHNIPQVFTQFQRLRGLVWNPDAKAYETQQVYTTNPTANVFGLAISEPYWIRAVVAGQEKDVLVQLFERRVLTYTPSNPPAFQVEMGNIGQHYYNWRYNSNQPNATATGSATPGATTVQPTGAPTVTAQPTATKTPGTIPSVNCLPAITTSGDTVQACVNNATPAQKSDVTVYGRLVVSGVAIPNVAMNTVWHYKSTDSTCGGTSGSDGVASCTRDIGGASSGFEVVIDVSFAYNGKTYTGKTSFTPQ